MVHMLNPDHFVNYREVWTHYCYCYSCSGHTGENR
jgi:hypothetical protein